MSIDIDKRIDPTTGLIEYTNMVKPYHSKILDVEVSYTYDDTINCTITDKFDSEIVLNTSDLEQISTCGWGIEWDPLKTTKDFPTVNIIQAIGDVFVEVEIDISSQQNLLLRRNPFNIKFNLGEFVYIKSTCQLPTAITDTDTKQTIAPGRIYQVVYRDDWVIRLSETYYDKDGILTVDDEVIVFATKGTGVISVHRITEQNMFIVENQLSPVFECILDSPDNDMFVFVDSYEITNINITTRQITVKGPNLYRSGRLSIGDTIYTRGNTGIGANQTFTVAQFPTLTSGNDTVVTVVQGISLQATVTGRLCITYDEISTTPIPTPALAGATSYWPVPNWSKGLAIQLQSSTDTLPVPLIEGKDYYYVPTVIFGKFKLSNTRYPLKISDIIGIDSLGFGVFTIKRSETFYPGATVYVSGTNKKISDGIYNVKETKQVTDGIMVITQQMIPRSTVVGKSKYDGTMRIVSPGWDYPFYCPNIQTDELFTDVMISEHLVIDIEDQPNSNLVCPTVPLSKAELGCPSFDDNCPYVGYPYPVIHTKTYKE